MKKKYIVELDEGAIEFAKNFFKEECEDFDVPIVSAIANGTPYNPSGDAISREALKKDFKSRLADCNEWIEKAKDKETKIRASAVKTFIGEVIMTIDNAPPVPQVVVFTETADEKAVADLKAELQSVIEPRLQGEWVAREDIDYLDENKAIHKHFQCNKTPKEAIANFNHLYGMVAPDIQRSLDVAIKALERTQCNQVVWEQGYECGYHQAKEDVIRRIKEQYNEHHELIPYWLSVGDVRGGTE